jgi:D-proline reductase (dithiol) PrdB
VGLIQREIERAGIATIGISIVREITNKVKPPRTISLRWPFGHPLGEPFNEAQHRTILFEAFKALYAIKEPGTIIDLPYRWRKERYENCSELNNIYIENLFKEEYINIKDMAMEGGIK